ncbi:MAG TPA: hypothetical protein DD434_12020 [Bacteroidales bacterium]|nr:hypothetical protein [Bacteroidales bacterium]
MKKPILLFLLLFFAIQGFAQEHKINISIDTTYIKLKQITKPAVNISLENAVKFNNKYYCIINEIPLTETSWDANKFIIISDKGDSVKEVELPNEFISSFYTDLFIYKDRVTIKDYYDLKTYYLDTIQYKWIETEEADDLIYEDEEFYVTYMYFGELGSTTWFRDKKTNKEYDIIGYKDVFRLNGDFYLIGYGGINILKDVSKLKLSKEDYYYKKIKEEKALKNQLFGSTNEPELISYFQETPYDIYSRENYSSIITSFISDNKLYHICSDSTKKYIGYISNKNMVIIDTLPDDIQMFNMYNSYRCRIQKDNSQIIKFDQKGDENQFGFIEIKDNDIKVRYFIHDIDSVDYIGEERFEMAFDSIFNYLISNKDITISQIDSLENIYGGIDTKIVFTKENTRDSKHNLVGGKRYYKIHDSIISNKIDYFYTENDSLVKQINFEWDKTPIYKKINEGYMQSYNPFDESPYEKNFDIQFNELLNKITKQLGKPKIKKEKNYKDYKWKRKGVFNIELERNFDEMIRINIDKD